MRSFILLVALVAASALPTSLRATTPASKADVARYAGQLLDENYKVDGPGATMIVARGDEVLFRGARGMGDIEHATPLAAGDLFEIASVTKQFTAAGVLKLVEAGKVSLDDPLSKYVKDYPDGDRITVQELLNHTAGIKEYFDIPRLDGPLYKGMTTAQLVDGFKDEAPDFAPGMGWAYSNSGYVLASAVIEAASGMPWYTYLQQALFQPLGLSHTSADPAIAAKQVHGYTLVDGKPVPARLLSMARPYANGGLVSNVDDLVKWNRALHAGRVLKRDDYRQMITPIGQAAPEQYGLGVWHTTLRGHEMLGHSGHLDGFSSYLLYLPESRISVAILQNMSRVAGVADPNENARKLAAFAIGDPYPAAATPIVADAATLQQAEGVYGIDLPGSSLGRVQGARVLRVSDGKLTIARTGDDRSGLIPTAVDTFQSSNSFDRLRLERNAAGAVTGIRLFTWGEGSGLLLARTADVPPLIALPRAALERVAGSYSAHGLVLRVFLDGDRLKVEFAGQPAVVLFAESPDTFLVDGVDATVAFTPIEGLPQVATLRQGGAVIELKRKP